MNSSISSVRPRVGIVEDNLAYRGVLFDELHKYAQEFDVLADTPGNAEDAVRFVKRAVPDVIFFDLRMPSRRMLDDKQLRHGIDALHRIKDDLPQVRVLVVSHTADPHHYALLYELFQLHINGYIVKRDEAEKNVAEAIRRVMRNESYYSATAAPIFRGFKNLTSREAETFLLMTQGKQNKDIVQDLAIDISTVKTHASNVLAKLNVASREELWDHDSLNWL